MAVTLVFHGGLFSLLPGSGPARRVDVHMRLASRVEIRGPAGRRSMDLEALFSSAARVDFAGSGRLRPRLMPVRPVSDVLPIDFQGFRKTVSFSGGIASGAGPRVEAGTLRRLAAVKKRGDASEVRREFEALTGISGHDGESLAPLVANFFERLTRERVRRWLPAYRIEVKLSGNGALAVVRPSWTYWGTVVLLMARGSSSGWIPIPRCPTTPRTIRTCWSIRPADEDGRQTPVGRSSPAVFVKNLARL